MLSRRAWLILSLALTLSLTAQGLTEQKQQPQRMSTPTKDLIEKARSSVKQVTIQELRKAMQDEEDIVILDVRDPNEYEPAHIPGAINVSRGLLEFSIWSAVPDTNSMVYVYCKTGARAALAAQRLTELGYKNVLAVDTGAIAWLRAGYPVQTPIVEEEVILVSAAQRAPLEA
ncbi:MAG: rhodanese-like domain-containing protein [Thermodesulfovibrionales bacterium]